MQTLNPAEPDKEILSVLPTANDPDDYQSELDAISVVNRMKNEHFIEELKDAVFLHEKH